MDNRCKVLVFSCDKYEDAWYPFFTLMDRYWTDCPYEFILNTESKNCDLNLEHIKVVTYNLYKQGENVPYGKRTLDHLRRMDCKYVIITMDDFFIRSRVNTEEVNKIVDWMDTDDKIASFCLVHHDDRHSCRYSRYEKGYEHYSLRPRYCKQNYDFQISVWRREALIKSWREYESPWEWEGPANYRSFHDGYKYYDLDEDAEFPFDYIDYKKGEWSGIRKGKWVKKTVYDLFKKEGIEIDYSIRGFFDPDKDINPGKTTIRSFLREVRSYGSRMRWPVVFYRFRRLIWCNMLGHELPLNYCEYIRHKYYDKV